MRSLGPSLVILLSLLACSKPAMAPAPVPGVAGEAATPSVAKQMSVAAASPLSDLNVVRTKIPPVLLWVQKAPYAPPGDSSCEGLASEIRELDAALGPDLDASLRSGDPGLVERGRSEAGEAAAGALRHTAEGLMPFRSWVRKLSGAERYSKQVLDAITAGIVRRAYLKGLRQAQGCPPLAALPIPSGPVKDSTD
jgi:hypothetical protein